MDDNIDINEIVIQKNQLLKTSVDMKSKNVYQVLLKSTFDISYIECKIYFDRKT
jgi:hypothetical protein